MNNNGELIALSLDAQNDNEKKGKVQKNDVEEEAEKGNLRLLLYNNRALSAVKPKSRVERYKWGTPAIPSILQFVAWL